jgi:hypothetical protein
MGEVLSLPGKIFGGITSALGGESAYDVQNVNFDRGAFDPNQQESDLTNLILARARGEAPSVAEQQMRTGLDEAARRASSFAASQRGVSPALAARLASQGQQELQSQGIGQTAMMRAQEQQRAEALGSGLLGDQRSARMAREQLGVNAALGTEGMRQRGAEAGADRQSGLLGGLGQAATMGLLMSDERAKTGVRDGRGAAREMLSKIEPSSYEYKNQAHGKGRHLSPMAQDLEKSEAGRSMVIDTPQGKMVDYGRGFGAILAAQADLNERLSQIEGRDKYAFGGMVGQENAGRVAEWMGNLSGKMPSVPQSPAEMPQDGPISTVKFNPNPEPPPQATLGQPASVRPKMSSFRPGYSKPPPQEQAPSNFASIFQNGAGRALGFAQGGLVDYPLPQFGNRYANMMQMAAIPEMLQSKGSSFDGMKLGMALAGLGGDGNVAGGMGGAGGGNEIGTRSIANYETSGFMAGGKVPGRAEVKGDHPSNDKVKALLSPGEIVLPRTVVQKGPNAIKSFAAKILEKEKRG